VRVLVTGGTGMLGRNLRAARGAAAHAILAPRRAELDLTRADDCRRYVAEARPDLVVHLAGRVGGIQANIDRAALALSDNLLMGINVVTAARAAGVPRLVNLGSSCMYPRDRAERLDVGQLLSGPLEPTNEAYALAKLSVWKLVEVIGHESPALCYRTLIACNLYGPFDHFDPLSSHLVPAAILKIDQALETGADTVEIWGDGAARREFMFAADLADFIWRFADRLDELPRTLNVGVGVDLSVDDYYARIAALMGYAGGFAHNLRRPAGMRRKLLDVSAQEALGWRPPTALDDGLRRTLAHFAHAKAAGAISAA